MVKLIVKREKRVLSLDNIVFGLTLRDGSHTMESGKIAFLFNLFVVF